MATMRGVVARLKPLRLRRERGRNGGVGGSDLDGAAALCMVTQPATHVPRATMQIWDTAANVTPQSHKVIESSRKSLPSAG